AIPLRPILLPADPAAAVTVLRHAVERAHTGAEAIAPVTNAEQARALPAEVPATTAAVLSTSGSSGEPKRTLLSRNALLASSRATAARLGGPGDWLLCLPAGYVAGFQVISRAALGGTAVATLPDGHFDSAAFAAAAARMTGDRRYTSLVPTQVTRLLADVQGRAALATFDTVLIGGARLDPGTERRLRAVTTAVVTYGMTETCGGCVYDGRPLDGVLVRIVDGLIHIGGPVLADGYLDHPDGGGFYREGDRHWYRTADRGHWDGERLVPTGRVDDLINTGGVKVSAVAIERELSEVPWVETAVVLALPDSEWGEVVAAYVVPRQTVSAPDPDALRAVVRERLGRAAVPKHLVVDPDLPLLPNSKIDRRAVRDRLTAAAGPRRA
ncbi:AMP-binding protein, partial [Nocardia sp. NPDC005978]|uniref:AMP-binding protein n=1 Tax=Nocardia sp. NPDC005978 TaxID=3156725 RepID=UPI0033AF69C3